MKTPTRSSEPVGENTNREFVREFRDEGTVNNSQPPSLCLLTNERCENQQLIGENTNMELGTCW